jgi:hypothetical protein
LAICSWSSSSESIFRSASSRKQSTPSKQRMTVKHSGKLNDRQREKLHLFQKKYEIGHIHNKDSSIHQIHLYSYCAWTVRFMKNNYISAQWKCHEKVSISWKTLGDESNWTNSK